MIKIFLRGLVLLVIVGLGGYVIYLDTGTLDTRIWPFAGFSMSASNDDRPNLKRLSEMPPLNSVDVGEDETQAIQEWQDENEVWHFSNQRADFQ